MNFLQLRQKDLQLYACQMHGESVPTQQCENEKTISFNVGA